MRPRITALFFAFTHACSQKRSEVLHIFGALSSNDIRFQSVDVSSPDIQADMEAPVEERYSADEDSAESKNVTKYKWRQLAAREMYHQQLWRDKLYQKLFSDVADSNATVEINLPQIWAVTENGLNGAPDSALRLPICEVHACALFLLNGLCVFAPFF